MQLDAPAKINLSFKILKRRGDGFHEIETLMAPISLFDRLTIAREETEGKISFVCSDPSLPVGDDNLVGARGGSVFARDQTADRSASSSCKKISRPAPVWVVVVVTLRRSCSD